MQVFVLLFICVGGVLSATISLEEKVFKSYEETMRPHKEECMKETKADPVLVEVIMKTGVVSTNHEVMCFAKCIFMKVEVMDKDGKFNKDVIVAKGVAVKLDLAEKCIKSSEIEPDLCKRAHDFAICVVKDLAKH